MQFNAKIENCSGQSVKQTIVQFIQVVNNSSIATRFWDSPTTLFVILHPVVVYDFYG